VAVKKKSAAKKVAKKAPAKKAAAKKAVKKSTAKKKTTAKRVVKKSVAKKSAKKAPAKRVAKKTAKKAPAKRAVKKRTSKVSASRISVPPVPLTSSRPAPVTSPIAPKPIAAPKQGASNRVVFAVVVGIVLLAAIVWSKSGSNGDDAAAPAPSISQSAEPTQTASASPSATTAVAAVEAPSKFVALKSADGLNLRWIAPTATDGLTGYNVEIRANGSGDWTTIASVPATQLTQAVTKSGDAGWTQFRVSSVYSDGQTAPAAVFGIPGEFK